MIDIAILCPIEPEFKIIRKVLPKSKPAKYQNLSFDLGKIKTDIFEWNIAIIEPEFYLNSFGLKVNEVITTLNPKYIFLAGVAGGIKDSKIGDIVIGTKAYFYEGGKETDKGFVSRPRVVENQSKKLLTIAKRISRESSSINTVIHFGAIASGNKVLASTDSQSIEIIKKHYNDTQAIEMESYDFALAASRLGKPYLNIRGISDLIDGKAKSDSEGHQKMASEKVALFLQQLIYNLPIPPQEIYYSTKVNSSNEISSLIESRKLRKGILNFKDDFIEVSEDLKTSQIRNLQLVEHVKMKGDLRCNWVRVVFIKDGKEEERFYSNSSLVGLGNWIGGSRGLLKQFQEFKSRQILTE